MTCLCQTMTAVFCRQANIAADNAPGVQAATCSIQASRERAQQLQYTLLTPCRKPCKFTQGVSQSRRHAVPHHAAWGSSIPAHNTTTLHIMRLAMRWRHAGPPAG